jgi:hypothetical protein
LIRLFNQELVWCGRGDSSSPLILFGGTLPRGPANGVTEVPLEVDSFRYQHGSLWLLYGSLRLSLVLFGYDYSNLFLCFGFIGGNPSPRKSLVKIHRGPICIADVTLATPSLMCVAIPRITRASYSGAVVNSNTTQSQRPLVIWLVSYFGSLTSGANEYRGLATE